MYVNYCDWSQQTAYVEHNLKAKNDVIYIE